MLWFTAIGMTTESKSERSSVGISDQHGIAHGGIPILSTRLEYRGFMQSEDDAGRIKRCSSTMALDQDVGRRLFTKSFSLGDPPQADEDDTWERRLEAFLDSRPAYKKLPRSERRRRNVEPLPTTKGSASTEGDRHAEITSPDLGKLEEDHMSRPTLLRRVSSNEVKRLAAPLAGYEFFGVLAEKNANLDDFRSKKISKGEMRRRNRETAQAYDKYYASVLDGVRDRMERHGRVAGPVTESSLRESRSTMLGSSERAPSWTERPSSTPRSLYRSRKVATKP